MYLNFQTFKKPLIHKVIVSVCDVVATEEKEAEKNKNTCKYVEEKPKENMKIHLIFKMSKIFHILNGICIKFYWNPKSNSKNV